LKENHSFNRSGRLASLYHPKNGYRKDWDRIRVFKMPERCQRETPNNDLLHFVMFLTFRQIARFLIIDSLKMGLLSVFHSCDV